MAESPIRTAVLGFGLAGKVFHCPFVSAVPGLELAAILQRTGGTAAEAYPSARIARSIEEILDDTSIELVVVGTPNDTHVEFAAAALRAGKHVVVDKPVAPTSAEVTTLIKLANQQGKLLAPFHNRRYDNDFLTVRKLVLEGTLGRIVTVDSNYDRFRPLQRAHSWKEAAGPGIGNLFDLGPHLIDQAVALFGTPTHVSASVRLERDTTDIDDAADVTLHYEVDGRPLLYRCHETMLAADPAPRFRVHGTLGSYTKAGLDPQERALLDGAKPPPLGSPQPWLPEPESAWGTLTLAARLTEPVALTRQPFPSVTGDYRNFYANVRDAIRGDAPLAIPAEDAFKTIRLLELALQSSHEQLVMDVAHCFALP
jgi:predicted dehydrogenase